MPRMRALAKFLLVDDVRVAPAHLGQEEREARAGDAAPEEDCKNKSAHSYVTYNKEERTRRHIEMGKENGIRTPEHGGRADVLGQAVERERGDDRAGLAARGGHAVCGRAEACREDLRGVAVCRPTVAATRLGLAHGADGGEQRARERKGTYVLAPKLKKNWRKAKHTMNAGVLSL